MSLRFRLLASVALLGAAGCGGGGKSTAETSAPLCADAPGPAPLRRMTRFEYGRTLHDLTGVDPKVADDLPPDEESLGYDDIATAYSVSSLHAARYLDVAETAAAALLADQTRLTAYAGCDPVADAACVDSFITAFGTAAWRRPLQADELTSLQQIHGDAFDGDEAGALSAVVAGMLQAPQFLYRPEPAGDATASQPLDDYALATRLAFLLTGAAPDATLRAAAAGGKLASDKGLMAETDRLLASDRAAELFVHFATSWWELEQVPTLDKDRTLYRTWTDEIPGALAEETRLFLTDAWTAGPTLAALLTTPATFVNQTLADFYGLASSPAGDDFEKVALDPTRGSGMLTQGSFLAAHAKVDQTSPTLRGKFVMAQLFCDAPPPPPPDIVVRPPTVDPRLSTRERFAQHTTEQLCATCHIYMDPVGFSFEHFDAVGRWRDVDGGKPVDATGMLRGTDVDGPLDGVPSLAAKLIASPEVATCAATQWFRYAFGRSEQTQGDVCTIGALADALTGPKGDFKQMVRATVRMAQFRNRSPETNP
jgi:hypothetical protein